MIPTDYRTPRSALPTITEPHCRAPTWSLRDPDDQEQVELLIGRSGSPQPSSRRARRRSFECMSDLELLRQLTHGDSKAWAVFHRRFRNLVVACITRICVPTLQNADLNDVVSDVFTNMIVNDYRRLRQYRVDGGCSVSSWIGVIACSTAHDHLRRHARNRHQLAPEADIERVAPEVDSPENDLLFRERCAFVDEALRRFSDRDRQFLELYFLEAMVPDEVAAQMQISVRTVYSKKAKIKARLEDLVRKAA